ncbi:UvrD-helicase domain-containing protein [Clostridium intestinale]|uniref:UvrD/REP helicase N-terminal domain-containing protein n=1 Tax=Clostridium intestinale DSM 6191 TaxID=1121320 RepID=A0A1M6EP09_9CLOT|nr:UvrD-helicase domain-containing protein [Clostridium intestinale]SHI87245.1 UvrD/REP helicase N-terminal domain-containing protein [Clostridium intestinale DSM 6191]
MFSNITDEDIAFAEKILLRNGDSFDENERRPVIANFIESFDVNACPGSGKTTVLLAKLVILSRKMPFDNGQGVCVLTHTNVAIDEIKNRLKDSSDILFNYPNFFGTIDSFINKFLTIPFYKNITGKELSCIDTDVYKDELEKLIHKSFPNIDRETNIKLRAGLKRCDIFLNNGSIDIDNSRILTPYYDEVRESVNRMLLDIFSKGIISHKQSFRLAQEYLKNFPMLKNYFCERFKLIFIDEMQDTKEYQESVLKEIFQDVRCIIQRFGDLNQNIGSGGGDEVCGWTLNSRNIKEINSTQRYGSQISSFLENLRVIKSGNLTGNTKINSYKPHIIIFDKKCILNIECIFCGLIKKYNLDKNTKRIFKAVGAIGQNPNNNDELTIKSYKSSYTKKRGGKTISFVEKILYNCSISPYPQTLYNDLLELMLKLLRNTDLNYNSTQLITELNTRFNDDYMEFKNKITSWSASIFDEPEEVLEDIKLSLLKLINLITPMINETVLDTHINYKNIDVLNLIALTTPNNNTTNDFIIDYDTIHGVKGETHTATLYLETKYNNGYKDLSDISKIINYLTADSTETENLGDEIEKALALSYVAMSRATHLVCIAISYDTIKDRLQSFAKRGYELIAASEDLQIKINKELFPF